MIIVLLMESEILKMKLMKSLNLKDKFLKLPIIQGGMGIGVSRCRLAGAVAKEGGMGVLSTAQIGYDDPDFTKHPEETNLRVLPEQIRKAKEIAGRQRYGRRQHHGLLHSCMKPMSKPPVPPV